MILNDGAYLIMTLSQTLFRRVVWSRFKTICITTVGALILIVVYGIARLE